MPSTLVSWVPRQLIIFILGSVDSQALFSVGTHLNAAIVLIAACLCQFALACWRSEVRAARPSHAIRVMVVPDRRLVSLLPRRRGERAPERSDGQTHGWHAGLFFRRRRQRLTSTFADLSVDTLPYRTAVCVHAAVSTRLSGKRCSHG